MLPVGQDRLDDLLQAAGVWKPYVSDQPRPYYWGVDWGDIAFERGYASELESSLWPKWVASLSAEAGEKEYRRTKDYSSVDRMQFCPRGDGWYPTWLEDAGDCENQGHDFITFCGRMNAFTARKRGIRRFGFGLLGLSYVAEAKFEDRREGGHFRVCLVDERDPNGEPGTLRPFEQATGTFMAHTKTEWESVWHVHAR
ncbi:hypothetical protein H5P28_11840 [Ruficoccus amylovorans]|uniref:Uncharacterized protein n=1 Tax=Ruficoccus amylovorans TaxID=1804625 RepID=A0A842HFA6_9BACT|nr:hypothetical protein [Ruficoccus amylovorans]MBC2594949.1 hypothetical protein [Ruficoccus amylovorans]